MEKANVDQAATRILRYKFNKGLFEDPYNVIDEMLQVVASPEWIANPTEIHTNEDLRAARPAIEVEMAERLQAESAVLLKNDNDLLPLKDGIKVYVQASNESMLNTTSSTSPSTPPSWRPWTRPMSSSVTSLPRMK